MEERNAEIQKSEEKELKITTNSEKYLKETGSWGLFFSILGFLMVGFLFIASVIVSIAFSIFPNEKFPANMGVILGVVYFVLAIVYLIPIIYLFRFSSTMKKALMDRNEEGLEYSLKNLKSHYKFVGIFTIAFIALYILIAIGMLFTGAVSNFWV